MDLTDFTDLTDSPPHAGFTLAELLVVMAITGILIGLTVPLGMNALRQHTFMNARESLRRALTTARADTMAGTGGAAWGVAIFSDRLVRFQGASYAARQSVFDVVTSVGPLVTLSGSSEVDFVRPDGLASSAATIVIRAGARAATTTVNVLGTIGVAIP